jgi:hypothetical protein
VIFLRRSTEACTETLISLSQLQDKIDLESSLFLIIFSTSYPRFDLSLLVVFYCEKKISSMVPMMIYNQGEFTSCLVMFLRRSTEACLDTLFSLPTTEVSLARKENLIGGVGLRTLQSSVSNLQMSMITLCLGLDKQET